MPIRDLLANGLRWTGGLAALEQLSPRDGLLVLCYHRIGDCKSDAYDSGLISATGEEFDEQVSFLKRKGWLVTLEEALTFIEGKSKDKRPRFRVLLTFDDGALDNYQTAFPILKAHNAQGVFFLSTKLVGSNAVLWWDEIAYLVKHAGNRRFTLAYPSPLQVDLDRDGVDESVARVSRLHRTENLDHDRFMSELKQALGETAPPTLERRYLDWDEARTMLAGGMAIGGHTHSHPVLSRLKPEEQHAELAQSRSILGHELGAEISTLAYPYGFKGAFTPQTEQIASETGYRAAFSFYGGFNTRDNVGRYNVLRVGVDGQSPSRFRAQVTMSHWKGKFWP